MALTAQEIYHALAALLIFVQTHNLWLGEAFRQFMFVGLAFGFLQWNESQQHVVLQAVSALLTVYAAKSNVSKQNVDAIVSKRADVIVGERTGTGSGI